MITSTNIFDDIADFPFLSISPNIFRDVERRDRERLIEKIARYTQMFELRGGTSTIPNWRLKQLIMMGGFGAFAPKDDKLYYLTGNLGDRPRPDYIPEYFIFDNPYIPWGGRLKLDKECVLVKNDTSLMGIMPILKRHTHLQTHIDLSFYITTVMSRLTAFGVAGRDQEAEAINEVIEDIERGKIRALTDQNILNQIHTHPYAGDARCITSLIEIMQYSKASEATDLGLQANWNAKRESLTASETLLNENVIHTFSDNMFECWKEWVDEVNEKYSDYLDNGLFTLEWGSSWKSNEREAENNFKKEEVEIEGMQQVVDSTNEPDEGQSKQEGEGDDGAAD